MIDDLIWLLHQQKQNINKFKSKPLKDMKNPTTLGRYRRKANKRQYYQTCYSFVNQQCVYYLPMVVRLQKWVHGFVLFQKFFRSRILDTGSYEQQLNNYGRHLQTDIWFAFLFLPVNLSAFEVYGCGSYHTFFVFVKQQQQCSLVIGDPCRFRSTSQTI